MVELFLQFHRIGDWAEAAFLLIPVGTDQREMTNDFGGITTTTHAFREDIPFPIEASWIGYYFIRLRVVDVLGYIGRIFTRSQGLKKGVGLPQPRTFLCLQYISCTL